MITAILDKKEPAVAAKPKEEPKKEEPKEEPKKEEPVKEEPAKVDPPKELPKKEEPRKMVQPLKYMVAVVDAATKTPLDAKVRMQAAKDKGVVGAVDKGEGVIEFTITATATKDYKISVEKEGYIFQTITEKIVGASATERTINKTIEMRKLVVGAVSILRNIYFDFNKATFRTESYGELNKLETMMKTKSKPASRDLRSH